MERDNGNQLEFEGEPIPPRPWYVRVLRAVVALLAIVGLVSLFGIRPLVLLQRTPGEVRQEEIAAKVNAEEIAVPVRVFIIRSADDARSSERDEADARRLVRAADNIWHQAGIGFSVERIAIVRASDEQLRDFARSPQAFFESVPGYDTQAINVFLVRALGGNVNGLSYGASRAVAVADKTSTYDFRVLAHELGHQFQLRHVPGRSSRLMAEGEVGVELTREEITRVRDFLGTR